MNTLTIKAENDIYELLCNDDLYEFTIDNIHYANYIIYTDNYGINYRVFIHDALLYNDIEFFVETFDYKNKLIILAYEKDLPMIALFEDNGNSANNNYIFREVGKQTEADTIIQLSYNDQKNIYEDTNHNEYKVFTKDNSKINKIIRHYKLIQKSADKNKQEQIVNFNDESLTNYLMIQLSQNPENFSNVYQDEGFSLYNEYRDESIYFSKYNSIEELKNKLENDALLASYSCANKINKDYFNDGEFIEAINNCVNNYPQSGNMYIRLAPSIDKRISQYERLLKINRIYTDYYNNDFIYGLAQKGEIPIFNDNLLYSESKYNYIKYNIESDKIRNLN
jgi:hypothetical protein